MTEHVCGMDSLYTFFIFICVQACVHAKLMTSSPLFKALMYTLDLCTTVLQTHVCMSGIHTPNLDCVHANCKPGQQNKPYEHVHVLRYGSLCITKCKSH